MREYTGSNNARSSKVLQEPTFHFFTVAEHGINPNLICTKERITLMTVQIEKITRFYMELLLCL